MIMCRTHPSSKTGLGVQTAECSVLASRASGGGGGGGGGNFEAHSMSWDSRTALGCKVQDSCNRVIWILRMGCLKLGRINWILFFYRTA